jgi:hypothetical protein
VKRILVAVVGLVLLASVVGVANTPVVPRVYGVYLFDNASGADAAKLAIIFNITVAFDASDIIVFGGGVPTVIAVSNNYAFIYVDVVKGGTLQLVLPPEYAGAVVTNAFWFE